MTFDVLGIGLDFGPINESLSKGLGKLFEHAIEKVGKKFGKAFEKHFVSPKSDKILKKRKKTMLAAVGAALNIVGVILQILDALGVLQPILQLIQGVFQAIGGAVMQTLAPAISKLAEVLFSPEMMELWQILGHIIGTILTPIIKVFAVVLKALMPALKPLLKLLGPVFASIVIILAKAIGIFIVMGLLPLVAAIWAVGAIIAGIVQFFQILTLQPGRALDDWNAMMLPIMASMIAGGAEILTMATGGYIPPKSGGTLALIGEGGEGEFVVPESKMGGIGNNEDMLWATQDNGDKLDKIIIILGSQGRLR